jgi:hypothetical protein
LIERVKQARFGSSQAMLAQHFSMGLKSGE